MRKSYREWKAEVDRFLLNLVGLSSDDLPDWSYRDAYDRGVAAATAARQALRAADAF